MPTAIDAAERFRSQLESQEIAANERLIRSYRRIFNRLKPMLESVMAELEKDEIVKPKTRLGRLTKLDRYQRLIAQTASELERFQALTISEVEAIAELGIQAGEKNARELVSMVIQEDAALAIGFHRLPTETIEQLLGFLSPDSPLFERINMLAPTTAQSVADAITEGVGLGRNPRRIAADVTNRLGMPLTSALRHVRTVQNYSYRESSRASYVANSDLVLGWQWHARLDNRVCMSCVVQHGTIHSVDETLNDHYNGRCAMIPVVKGFDPVTIEGGETWFLRQDEETQRALMGKGAFEAWRAGKFKIGQLSGEREDAVYGKMRQVVPLKSLAPTTRQATKQIEDVLADAGYDPVAHIRPTGKAPRGQGQEFADRRWIANKIMAQMRLRDTNRSYLENYRGQKNQQARATHAKVRLQELNRAIPTVLEIADGPGDWSFKRELINGVFGYVSEATARK